MKQALLLFALVIGVAQAVDYHTAGDIIKILEKSPIEFQIEPFSEKDVPVSDEVLPHGIFVKQHEGTGVFTDYSTEYGQNSDYTELLKKAEEAFHAGNMPQAQENYRKMLEISPANSQIMTYLGQTYSDANDPAEAAKWYTKAIEANYLDYMAHWFLADLLKDKGQIEEAVKEITIAHLLNRNNPRILISLQKIYKADGRPWSDWQFSPKCALELTPGKKTVVKVDYASPEWLAYAMCKAVWASEPGYRESMLAGTKESPRVIEERECIYNFIAAREASEKKDAPVDDTAIQMLMAASEKGRLDGYIIYEIVLRDEPKLALHFNAENIQPLVDYLLEFRAPKKPAETDGEK